MKKIIPISIVALLILFAFISFLPETKESKSQERKQKIESQFSIINGEHIELTKQIKDGLSDPGSFEHIETTYSDVDTAIFVVEKYSWMNAAGERERGLVKALVNNEGKINIIEKR